MKTVAFVPIRLNSKRVVGKNLKMLGDKPLMCYVLETLAKAKGVDEVFCYCSNEDVIKYLPEGVKFLKRPEFLDRDETLGKEIYEEFTKTVDDDMAMYVAASVMSVTVRTDDCLMSRKALPGIFHTELLRTLCR